MIEGPHRGGRIGGRSTPVSGKGVRLVGGALVALSLLAVAGRLGASTVGPPIVVTERTLPPPPATEPPVTVVRTHVVLPEAPVRAAQARGVLWVTGRETVYRVAPGVDARMVTLPWSGSGVVLDVAARGQSVWLADGRPGSVWRLDPDGTVISRIATGRPLTGTVRIAVTRDEDDRETVWVACCGRRSGAVLQIDPVAERVVREIPIPSGPTALAADERGAMVTTDLSELIEISASTGAARAILRNSPGSLLHEVKLTRDAAWLAVPGPGLVLRWDRAGGELRSYRLPHGVSTLAAGRSGVWALSRDGFSVTPLRREAQPPFDLIPTGDRPARQLVAGRNALWLVLDGGAGVSRLSFPGDPGLGRI
jgi:hypothetical protein